jgi:hypothetical protein
VIAVELGRHVEGDELAGARHPISRDAVDDLLVDRDAHGARIAVGEDGT